MRARRCGFADRPRPINLARVVQHDAGRERRQQNEHDRYNQRFGAKIRPTTGSPHSDAGTLPRSLPQYRDDAVVITPEARLAGPQIRGMIEGIIAEFARPETRFDLIARAAEGPIATFVWKAETARNVYDLGSETYVLKDGKVAYQTFRRQGDAALAAVAGPPTQPIIWENSHARDAEIPA